MFAANAAFLTNPAWTRFLDASWRGGQGYFDASGRQPVDTVVAIKLSLYHLYGALLGLPGPHAERLPVLVGRIAGAVSEGGALRFMDEVTEHPAHCSFAAEALGCAAHHGGSVGLAEATRSRAGDALARIVTRNPRVRPPSGTSGRTQQLRFEVLAYYWHWQHTGDARDRELFFELFQNGVDHYTRPFALEGGYIAPALHPDWTWNYASASGTSTSFATNTHTPAYYLAEQNGFLFVYLHGLRAGTIPRDAGWDRFCQGYVGGLFRNYSRAGHMSVDVDGYGVHRAWYGSGLSGAPPYDAAAASAVLGFPPEWPAWLAWYADRHEAFLQRFDAFGRTGLLPQFPYGHRVTIEKQFNVFSGANFYALLARACHEYASIPGPPPAAPPAFCDHAWWHQWLRVSTPAYETSTVAATTLRNIPMVKHFGDPHLGTLHGGCPVANLMVGDRLLYATGNAHAGLWHVEVTDVNDGVHRSSGTSFDDRPFFAATDAGGAIRTAEQFADYAPAAPQPLEGGECQTVWRKSVVPAQIQFWSRHRWAADGFSFDWGYRGRAGFYIAAGVFNFPVPAGMGPEVADAAGRWSALADGARWEGCPAGFRWSDGPASVEVRLTPRQPLPAGAHTVCEAVPDGPGQPGGENSFCPFRLLRLRVVLPRAHEMAFAVEVRPGGG